MPRRIAHIDLDAFFVSVERVKNPDLLGKPVIVGGTGNRGVVSSCSYEARKMGVRSAMPSFKARALCPEGIFVRGSMDDYSAFSRKVAEIIEERAPVVEKASIDEFYLDLTGMDKYLNPWQLLLDIRKAISAELSLPISFALAGNKLVSKIATNEVKPNGQIEIPDGTEAAYLAPLAIGKMPGLGQKTEQILLAKGITTLGMLANTASAPLTHWLGPAAAIWPLRAVGIDENEVSTHRDQKSISAEETFGTDTKDMAFLENELLRLLEKACHSLRRRGKMAGCIGLKLRYQNFETTQQQKTIGYTANETALLPVARQLLGTLWDKTQSVRLLGVKLSQLIGCSAQMNLFDRQEEQQNLLSAIDNINNEMGNGTVRRAATGQTRSSENVSGWHSRNIENQ